MCNLIFYSLIPTNNGDYEQNIRYSCNVQKVKINIKRSFNVMHQLISLPFCHVYLCNTSLFNRLQQCSWNLKLNQFVAEQAFADRQWEHIAQ